MKSVTRHFLSKTLAAACLISAALASSASAAFVTWEFNPTGLNGNVGSASRTYTQSGTNLTVRGYDNVAGADTAHQLYFKNEPMVGGAFERGLGLVGTPSNELNVNSDGSVAQYLQLDLRAILGSALGVFSNAQIQVTSMQNGEGYRLFGSSTMGVLGTQITGSILGLANDNQWISVPNFGDYQFVSVGGVSGRVLPVAFRAEITPVPEMDAFFPIIGLVAAVSCTQFLRRRAARLSACNS